MSDTKNIFEGMLQTIEQNAANSIKANEGDYVLDGLLYCGKCNTPKQCEIELFGRTRKPMCLCKCESEKRKVEKDEYDRQQKMLRIQKLRRMGFPDQEMASWTFANDDRTNEKVTSIALKYVENFEEMRKRGKGIVFYGKVGTGKTYISACIANALIDRGYACLVTNFARLVNTINGMYDGKQEYIDGLSRFDLLVIDDLAAERDTEYMNEIVQNIIDSRYRAGLPTIITTNLTNDELKNPADIRKQRTYSRVLEMCIPVEVQGTDRRKVKLVEDYADLKDILGL